MEISVFAGSVAQLRQCCVPDLKALVVGLVPSRDSFISSLFHPVNMYGVVI